MKGIKFKNFMFYTAWDWLFIFPSVIIEKDNVMFSRHNFSIQIHFLGFHMRWLWWWEK